MRIKTSNIKRKKRLLASLVLIAFLFTVILARLFYVEVVMQTTLKSRALDQWTRDVAITGERGLILDRNGEVLVSNATTYTVYVRPVSVTDDETTASALSSVLGVNYDKLLDKLKKKVSEVTVAKNVSASDIARLRNTEGVDGVYYAQNIKRVYTFGEFLTQILGFTNVDGKGQSGLELYYDDVLTGKDGYILTETDLVGRELASNTTSFVYGESGSDLYLTIDARIQTMAENAVRAAYAEYSPTRVSCIVMDPSDGSILAMAETPSYDLNAVPRDNVAELFSLSKSTLVSSVYEPGSTFKILTAAIGLDSGKISRNYALYCPGYRVVDGQKIKCWRTIGHGSESFDEGVENSCNCLFMDIASRVGVETFYDYLDRFSVNARSGVDISGEGKGLLISESSVKNVDLARIGFGQAIAVTPIGLVSAVAAAINGGIKVTPHLMKKVVSSDGVIEKVSAPVSGERIIKESTSTELRDILVGVVSDGSGRNASIDGYEIGGKTGTAQKYENGSIARGKYVSSFIGFIGKETASYLTLFIVDEPEGYVYYGSLVAAPYVKQIFEGIIEYENIVGDNDDTTPTVVMPYLIDMPLREAMDTLNSVGLKYEIDGDGGVVTQQFPIENSAVKQGAVILIKTE